MGKLRLDVDALEVESFETAREEGAGTVLGNTGNPGVLGTCDPETCAGGGEATQQTACNQYTCWAGCGPTIPPAAGCNTDVSTCPCTSPTCTCPQNTCAQTCVVNSCVRPCL